MWRSRCCRNNSYDGPRAGAESDWFQRIEKTIYSGGRFGVEPARGTPFLCSPESTRSYRAVRSGEGVQLEASRQAAEWVRCQVVRQRDDALSEAP